MAAAERVVVPDAQHPSQDGGMPPQSNASSASSSHDKPHALPGRVQDLVHAPPPQHRHHHHAHHQQQQQHQQPPHPPAIDAQSFVRLEQQVAYNYSCLQTHQDSLTHLDQALGQFQTDVLRALEDIRAEVRANKASTSSHSNNQQARYDPGDIDLLASQIATVTTKANEVDNLRVQLELTKRRLKRIEDDTVSHAAHVTRPASTSSRRGSAAYDTPVVPQRVPSGSHQLLPPIHTADPASPEQSVQAPSYHVTPVNDPVSAVPHRSLTDHRPASNDSYPHHAANPPGYRPAEPLPPPSTLSGWRPAAGTPHSAHPSSATSHPPGKPADYEHREHREHRYPGATTLVDMHMHNPASSAAAAAAVRGQYPPTFVAVNQAPKRSYDDRASRDRSAPASPKRPKLAPLKPRNSLGEESHPSNSTPPSYPPQSGHDSAHYSAAPRIAPNERHVQPPPPPHLITTPASATATTSSYRFVTSTTPADAHEAWRADADGHHPSSASRGRGRGRGRGRARVVSRGSAAGATSAGPTTQPPPESAQERDTPEWDHGKADWHARQPSPNGAYYSQPMHPAGRLGDAAPLPPGPPPLDFPTTPSSSSAAPGIPLPQDHFTLQHDSLSSSGKKTRTKPIRNAEGILIRKDGRPDMRSVSSANNLRKVHAKKEAERVDGDGRTPTSARSLAPAQSSSPDDMNDDDYDRATDLPQGSRSATPGTTQGEGEGDLDADADRLLEPGPPLPAYVADALVEKKATATAPDGWFPRRDVEDAPPVRAVKAEEIKDDRPADGHVYPDEVHEKMASSEL